MMYYEIFGVLNACVSSKSNLYMIDQYMHDLEIIQEQN